MNFSLMRYEAPSDSLRRIVLDQIDGAILQLARDDNLNEGIHEARKHFKRVRAVLRLSRGALPAEIYRSENQFFRDQGRIFSPIRDSAVYIETMDMLRHRYGLQVTDASFWRLRQSLVEEHGSVLKSFAGDEWLLPSVIEALRMHVAGHWTGGFALPDSLCSQPGFAGPMAAAWKKKRSPMPNPPPRISMPGASGSNISGTSFRSCGHSGPR